ncbi:MAG: hypothetical protein A2Z14_05370 [Chloroflexi bacterium RBG_16_48_8]|nr:MAG: hypothetical protein A2Z14_05370 [Chloroflexi bacterium RBG_16_48_8]
MILSIMLSLLLCPLADKGFSHLTMAEALVQAFKTLPPMTGTFDAPIGTQIPAISPHPTLGPWQYFDENDMNRPEVDLIEEGNDLFGYGPISGSDNLYAVTDEVGTHYLIVHKDSELL